MSESQALCIECKKVEKDAEKMLTCMYCFSAAHFKCRNLNVNAARRLKENMYFCSQNCCKIYQRIIDMQNLKSSIVNGLVAQLNETIVNVVAQQMMVFRSEVKQITSAIEKSQEFLSNKFDSIVKDFHELRKENDILKREVTSLKQKQNSILKTVNILEHNVDKTNRHANRNSAVVLGVPFLPGEHTLEIVQKIVNCYGLNIEHSAIISAFRLAGKNNSRHSLVPIRVIFKDSYTKEIIFAKKKEFDKLPSTSVDSKLVINGNCTTITMRNELTPMSLELLNEMRLNQQKLGIKYVWASKEGNILVKKSEQSKPQLIKTRSDLHEVLNRYNNLLSDKCATSPTNVCANRNINVK